MSLSDITPLVTQAEFPYNLAHALGMRGFTRQYVQQRREQFARVLPILVLITLSLAVSLATRTAHFKIGHATTVQAIAGDAKPQQLDTDGFQYPPPAVKVAKLDAPTFYPRVSPAGVPVPVLLLDESLYNRPPPSR